MSENYSYWLVEQFKQMKGLNSDRQASMEIDGMTSGSLGEIKKGKRHLTEEQGLFISEACGLNPGEVLVKLHIERTKSSKAAESYKDILKKIAGAVAGIVLTLGMMGLPASDAQASPAR